MQLTKDRLLGCLLGGAVGDALGAPVEFMSLRDIRARYGDQGSRDFDACYGIDGGAITDDTQMTLFTLEGLLLSDRATNPVPAVLRAYLRWLHTQGIPWEEAGRSIKDVEATPQGGLVRVEALHSQRAPGNTCLTALRASAYGKVGTTTDPINDSKGCGGVMRAAPAGIFSSYVSDSFWLGAAIAALTHGHPSGYLSAGVLSAMTSLLLRGADLETALGSATAELRKHPRHEETLNALTRARELAARGRPTPEALESLGGGWVGEEALAISVCCALVGEDFEDALLLSVNHSGDSDSTGAICGNLLGARDGVGVIPPRWQAGVELGEVVRGLADEAYRLLSRPAAP
ncbi:ADP-ribosylglycohydrolase family protein [Allokutzneria sp. A3M-2-11 16]|uniref:ADP-ribosylglycohydrolase family protein n=1 Tax=Allokutzneria sp. A3M-2-11 16 TaxID=2962043 RepID=UPI0020B75340|nr:ADP-ribosylglycohydrolase family protein [Allokutzneria sp. A3M-2-11 16]MCP3799483.1 ADP-ribosylglycohydrolase family protein [Allokutzneria sp. A3M-2-11 16]